MVITYNKYTVFDTEHSIKIECTINYSNIYSNFFPNELIILCMLGQRTKYG